MLRLMLLARMCNMQPMGCLQPRTATDATQCKSEACLKYCKTFRDLFCNPMCGFQARTMTMSCRTVVKLDIVHTRLMTNPPPHAPNVSFILSAKGWEAVLPGAMHSILRGCYGV